MSVEKRWRFQHKWLRRYHDTDDDDDMLMMIKMMHISDANVGPYNAVVMSGTSVHMRCRNFDSNVASCETASDESNMYWKFFPVGSSKASTYHKIPPERLLFNKTCDGQFDIIINETRLEDAGTYTCFLTNGPDHTAELVVLGKYELLMFEMNIQIWIQLGTILCCYGWICMNTSDCVCVFQLCISSFNFVYYVSYVYLLIPYSHCYINCITMLSLSLGYLINCSYEAWRSFSFLNRPWTNHYSLLEKV